GPFTAKWRGTKRRGDVQLANVRTLAYSGKENQFAPSKEFLLLVDYPIDEEAGKTRRDDEERLALARKHGGRQATAAWLPDMLVPEEEARPVECAAPATVRADP